MAVPKWYLTALQHIMDGTLDLDTGTFKEILLTSAYTFDQDAHDFRDDLGANEASGGSGYPAGGFTVVPTITKDGASNEIRWDLDDTSQAITGGPFAFRYGVYYKVIGTPATDPIIGYVDYGAQSITDATLNITRTIPLKLTAAA